MLYGPRATTPRLAGAMPKLRPSVSLATMTTMRPAAEITAVTGSPASGAAADARSSGGPATDSVVVAAATKDRSTIRARRRAIVSTTISDSLVSRSNPVMWPVRRNSPSRLNDNSVNSAAQTARAVRSRVCSDNIAVGAARMPRCRGLCDRMRRRIVVDEVRLACPVEQLARDFRLDSPVAAERDHLIEQVSRVAGAKRPPERLVIAAQQVRHHDLVIPQVTAAAVQLEDFGELLDRRIDDGHLVRDAAKERFVRQRFRIEVRGEHDEDVERHLEFLAGVQRQVVEAALERHDPAVQQLLRADALPSEVVDEEHAAVGLQLNRRFVELRERVERQVELVERQLAADHDDRTANPHPPAGARRRRDDARRPRVVGPVGLERLVVDRIEHRDDLAVDVD